MRKSFISASATWTRLLTKWTKAALSVTQSGNVALRCLLIDRRLFYFLNSTKSRTILPQNITKTTQNNNSTVTYQLVSLIYSSRNNQWKLLLLKLDLYNMKYFNVDFYLLFV